MNDMEALRKRFDDESTVYKQLEKDRERSIMNRQQLEGQLTENTLVKEEMDYLDDDAVIYKMIGPVLVKQDLNEAKQNVSKRIEYINAEIKRLEETMKDSLRKHDTQKETLSNLQNEMRQVHMKSVGK